MKILDGVVLRYLLKFYTLMQKYPSPKKYAKVVIIEKIRLNANIANIYTATFTKNYPSNIFRPGQLNHALANDIRKTIGKNYITLRKEDKEFLHPRDLRERVLKKFESEGIFIHLVTKKDITHWERKTNQIDKKHSYDKVRNNRGGKPSAYILRDEIEILKKVLRKPEAIDFLYKKMIESGFPHKFAKYNILAFLHAAKLNEKTLHRSMGIGASFMQDSVKEEDTAKF